MSRDQATAAALVVDVETGTTTPILEQHDDGWVERVDGAPRWMPDGRLVYVEEADDTRRLVVDGTALTGQTFTSEPSSTRVTTPSCSSPRPGSDRLTRRPARRMCTASPSTTPAVRRSGCRTSRACTTRYAAGRLTILVSSTLTTSAQVTRVLRDGQPIGQVVSHAVDPGIAPRFDLVELGDRRIPTVVQLPSGYTDGAGLLPVLVASYAGPVIPTVVCSRRTQLLTQWFADQGFAVLVIDGRGTPGHSVSWEKAVRHDLAGPTLDDQIEALHAAAQTYPLDLTRVAISGWSFGGYLAGLAALRRPDVFHAAVVGAPVTDWRLYDTAYTERYLGLPQTNPEVYAASSLITDQGLSGAAETTRPLLVIHGLADDNVTVANTLRLSSALLAAGRPHEVLPLTGVTHMTSSEGLEANLMRHQVEFLTRALGPLEPRRV